MRANLTPEADIAADEPLVARLIAEQHPDLAAPLRLVSDGWDNRVFRLGDDLAVRIPRREAAAHLVEHEQRALPAIAARVGVPVPAPVRVGVPSATFPWAWSILPWFEGVDGAAVDGAARRGIADELAAFVGRLHVPAPADAPHNPVRGVPLITRDAAVQERLDRLSTRLDVAPLRAAWAEALAAPPWDGPALWLHGDLHPGNLLLSSSGGLAAVLDFGDVTAGDPATDLATAWLTFDEEGREAFRAAMPQPPCADADQWAATWTRARGWAVTMGSALAAHSDDNPRMASLGRHALTQLA
ncbi:aminoglycoside phosphotransferase family protein [Leifsonia sp. F6_8S_P_1B]|uniref:Aminoglycoside phosphotransferase family protein n=1 Tax=Leifsonia williamsii TaxID=3035919 RepID=A0ABT8K680_9MICO|nr:aminoglycoside phosphotransferase family protein [Leifsonia williamsii]MDN4612963.1 aminoglycoside phosphotransferase family protein [Leifsonia williamsii]